MLGKGGQSISVAQVRQVEGNPQVKLVVIILPAGFGIDLVQAHIRAILHEHHSYVALRAVSVVDHCPDEQGMFLPGEILYLSYGEIGAIVIRRDFS